MQEGQISPGGRGERFVTNVLWGWLAVGVNIIVGQIWLHKLLIAPGS